MLIKKCLLFLFIFLSLTIFAQTPEKAIEKIKVNYTTESIYIHYDKQNYVAGETIWFKAYLFAGLRLSSFSSVLNVELLNDSGRVVKKKILPLIGSTAVGEFALPKDSPQMNYIVRAYTRPMLNFGSDYFYEHPISVFNPSSITKTTGSVLEENVYFLPEGGNIIAGLPNNIAFKCTDRYGYPLNVSGDISDSKGTLITSFKSVHDGMGTFAFFPLPDERYTAVCTVNSKSFKVGLPTINISGLSFMVQTAENKKYFVINKEKIANEEMQPAYVLAIMDNVVAFRQDLPQELKYIRGQIPLDQLPSGILQLTVFNKKDQPLAERMVFINNNDFLVPGNFTKEILSFKAKAKNKFYFDLDEGIAGTYSVAITDRDKEIPSNNRESIVSKIFLSNNIKGNLFNPLYYFEATDGQRTNDLDLVMLTNGWRRFNWDQVLNNKLPSLSYKDPSYVSIAGKAYRAGNNQLLTNTELSVFITTKDSAIDIIPIPVNASGDFELSGMIFQDTAKLTFQENSAKDKAVSLSLSSLSLSKMFSYIPKSLAGYVKPMNVDVGMSNNIKELYSASLNSLYKDALLLNDVRLSAAKNKNKSVAVNDRYAKGIFSGEANNTVDFITNPPRTNLSTNIFEYLKGRLTSVNITGNPGNYFVNYRNTKSLIGGAIPMSIFLNGASVSTNDLIYVPVSDIALVKVFGTGFVGAEGNGVGGALAIFTKNADDRAANVGTSFNTMKIEGFSPVKEFFSPNYEEDNRNTTDNDERTTLYWNPYIETTTTDKRINILFYNSDAAKSYKMILTGVTADGKMLYIEKDITN